MRVPQILAAIPGGMFWDNESRLGWLVLGRLMGLVYLCSFGLFEMAATTGNLGETASSVITLAILAVFESTWLSIVATVRRQRGER